MTAGAPSHPRPSFSPLPRSANQWGALRLGSHLLFSRYGREDENVAKATLRSIGIQNGLCRNLSAFPRIGLLREFEISGGGKYSSTQHLRAGSQDVYVSGSD
jgi:hypothetical protein